MSDKGSMLVGNNDSGDRNGHMSRPSENCYTGDDTYLYYLSKRGWSMFLTGENGTPSVSMRPER